jgi:hypothetical protein
MTVQSNTSAAYQSCPLLPYQGSSYYNESQTYEVTYHKIRTLLQQGETFQQDESFQQLLDLLPKEYKTMEFYCSLLPLIFSNPHISLPSLQLIVSSEPLILRYQDQYGNSLFHYLSMSPPDMDIVRYLFTFDPFSLTQLNQCGETCLHLALQSQPLQVDLIQLLVDCNPEALWVTSKANKLPIHYLFRTSSAEVEKEKARIACLSILLKIHPLSAYAEITERITRINLQSLTSPVSIAHTAEGPGGTGGTTTPLIVQIERKWSPHSEATRKMAEEENGKVYRSLSPLLTLPFSSPHSGPPSHRLNHHNSHGLSYTRQKVSLPFSSWHLVEAQATQGRAPAARLCLEHDRHLIPDQRQMRSQ